MHSQIKARMHLVRYALFAGAAIIINIAIQNVVLATLAAVWFSIYVAMLAGNGAGLVFKYAVDKFWVFEDQDRTVQGNSRKFVMYALFGVLTTAMFWGVELAFHYAFQTAIMTNVGAIVGLTLGYVIKYNLDKHFTFRDRTRDLASP